MSTFSCDRCGYFYNSCDGDEALGIEPGTSASDAFGGECPMCGAVDGRDDDDSGDNPLKFW